MEEVRGIDCEMDDVNDGVSLLLADAETVMDSLLDTETVAESDPDGDADKECVMEPDTVAV